MGFASGPITFRRFFLCGEHPDSLSNGWFDAIAARAFGRQREEASDGSETGWIVPNHLCDVDFSSPDRVTFGRFVFLAMRVDRTAAPSAIVQSYRKMEETAALEASGRVSLTSAERRLAKEAALARAEKEARAGQFRRTTAYPLLIDFQEGVVYFGSLGAPAADRLMVLFSETFDTTIVPATVEEVAYRIAQRQGRVRVFEDVHPTRFVEPPASGDQADTVAFPGQDRRFLGWEFLAWLWHRVDAHEGLFELKRQRSVTVAVERMMHLVCSFDLTGSDTIRTDAPARAPEAYAALGIGKVPTSMGLLIAGDDEWGLTLDGPRYHVSGLRLTSPEEEDDPVSELEHRFSQIRDLSATLDQLFGEFLRQRLDKDWDKEAAAMSRWARDHRRKPTKEHHMQLATA